MGEYPLAAAGQSDVDVSRVDLVVRYGIHENVIPIDVSGR